MPRVKRLDEYFVVVRTQPRLKTRNSGAVTKSVLPVLMLCNALVFRKRGSAGSAMTYDGPLWKQMHFGEEKKIPFRFFLEFVFRCFMYQRLMWGSKKLCLGAYRLQILFIIINNQ